MPVVPQVDIDRAGTLGNDQQEIDAETDGDDECSDCGIISHSGGSGPSHVKDLELEVIEFADSTQWTTEIGGEQGGDNAQANETHADIEAGLERLTEFHADAKADNREENRHHDAGT